MQRSAARRACVRGGWRARAARSSPPSSRSCDPLSVQLFSKLSARGVAAAAAKAPPTGQVRDAHVVGVPRLRAFRPARRPAGARGALLAQALCAVFASTVRAACPGPCASACLACHRSARHARDRYGLAAPLECCANRRARPLGSVRTFWRGRLRLFTRASVSVARVTKGCLHHALAASGGALALPNVVPRKVAQRRRRRRPPPPITPHSPCAAPPAADAQAVQQGAGARQCSTGTGGWRVGLRT